jgi:hypothetical protein
MGKQIVRDDLTLTAKMRHGVGQIGRVPMNNCSD